MGYRSHVLIALKDNLVKDFLNSMKLNVAAQFIHCDSIDHKDGWTLFYFSNVKWYDSYEEVAAWESFHRSISDNCEDYEFHRMGEESDDYTCDNHGCSPFNIYMNRSLDFEA